MRPDMERFKTDGCRCDECREANAAYYRGRRDGVTAPSFAPKSETEEWKAEGACRDHDPDLFFPDRGEDTDTAKRICAGCTVRRECLTCALTAPRERNGIWGGTSGRERRKLTLASIEGRPLPPITYGADARAQANTRAAQRRKATRPVAPPPSTAAATRRQAEREAIAATVVEIGPRRATGRILEGASR